MLAGLLGGLAVGWRWWGGLDRAVSQMVAGQPPWLRPLMLAFTALGSSAWLVTLAVAMAGILAWRRRWRLAGVMLTALAALPLASLLKVAVHRPRPLTAYASELHSYSFPSGHATGSAAVYGGLMVVVASHLAPRQRRWVWLTGCGVIGLIGLSRVWLGAHFPTDVLGGWSLGALVAIIAGRGARPGASLLRAGHRK